MLRRFYELRKEVTLFLKNKGQPVAEMEDESWLYDLAFLVDVTTQGRPWQVRGPIQWRVQKVLKGASSDIDRNR